MEITGIDQAHLLTMAKACHEINRAYCESLGDHSQVAWELASKDIQDSAVHGIMFNLMNPDSKPSDQHETWMKFKAEQGWVYGVDKDAEKKTHPCMVPYEELPQAQRTKDYLFKAVFSNVRQILGV